MCMICVDSLSLSSHTDVYMKGAPLLQLLSPLHYQPIGMASTPASTSHSSFLALRLKQQERYSVFM